MQRVSIRVKGKAIPVTAVNTIIVGAGAAGMNCAVQLVRNWRAMGVTDAGEKVLVVTGGLSLGASRMSGSDKQTYYKMGTSPRVPDTAEDFAKTLTAFGCCHGDNALAEGINSLRGFYHLVEVGVPFPHDPSGAFIGYKTDHDPYERATSAGPKTSKFMSQCLQAEAEQLGVKIVDKQVVLEFVTSDSKDGKRIVAMLCLDRAKAAGKNLGLTAFVAENWVLAAGGPGEIYSATVYPRGQVGIHGPAFRAGLEACNLTESQFGLASTQFRWNVSGTYMQVVPRIYSTDADGGDEREFLTEYFDDMSSMATNIFLKGYQWPFDAQRITDHQSSLVDMAVHQETVVRGRRVWMDFLKNPIGKAGWDAFRLDGLGKEALEYLQKTGAMQARPIERLEHMNPPAIAIYAENKIDLYRQPLEIAVCAQHMNGGFAINQWWESNVAHTFVIGEMAGTHGVKRPGGSALNAGQVGGIRAAEYIARVYGAKEAKLASCRAAVQRRAAEAMQRLQDMLAKGRAAKVTVAAAMEQIGRRMTRFGAHLRSRSGAEQAIAEARRQLREIDELGLRISGAKDLPRLVQAEQQCLTQLAILVAVRAMFDRNVGSRGSHCILDDSGIEMHLALVEPSTGRPYRFKQENLDLRNVILGVRYNPAAKDLFETSEALPRAIPNRQIAFEPAWTEFREGRIYQT